VRIFVVLVKVPGAVTGGLYMAIVSSLDKRLLFVPAVRFQTPWLRTDHRAPTAATWCFFVLHLVSLVPVSSFQSPAWLLRGNFDS
jgi:hypothetical protein